MKEYVKRYSPVREFISECLVKSESNARMYKQTMYNRFQKWCEGNDFDNPFDNIRGFLAEAQKQFPHLGNEAEAEIVRIIFEKYADGTGYNQLLAYLNGMGYRTKRGNQFGKNSLYSILTNEKYAGTYVFNKRQEKNAMGKRNPTIRPKDEWIIAQDAIPAIIDQRTFDIVQAKMSENKRKAGQYTAKEIYLLSGLIFCSESGHSMCGNVRTNGRLSGNYASYRCSGQHNKQGCRNSEIRRNYIDNYVLDELYNRLFSKVSIRNLTEMLNDYNDNIMMALQSDSDINTIKTQLQSQLL